MRGEDQVSIDMDDVSAFWVDGELEGLIAVVCVSMPGDFFIVHIGSPDGYFDAVEVPCFYALHVSDQHDGFFSVLFSVGFNPSDLEGVDVFVDGWDAHASCVDVHVGQVGGMGVHPVPFADFLGVVDDAEDITVVVVDDIMDQGVVCLFLEF